LRHDAVRRDLRPARASRTQRLDLTYPISFQSKPTIDRARVNTLTSRSSVSVDGGVSPG
jgi:hypothetical protein